jgi:hypothetical protein
MGKHEISNRESRRRAAHIEQLKVSKAATQEMAWRWYNAYQATGLPGSGDAAFGFLTSVLRQDDDGQQCLVRWHNGTYTSVWFSDSCFAEGTPVVVKTRWNDNDGDGEVWVTERPMWVTEFVDVMPLDAEETYEDYWRWSRELDDLALSDLMMLAPVESERLPAQPAQVTRPASRRGVVAKVRERLSLGPTAQNRPDVDEQRSAPGRER